jgi:hypothetical protein
LFFSLLGSKVIFRKPIKNPVRRISGERGSILIKARTSYITRPPRSGEPDIGMHMFIMIGLAVLIR